MNAKMPYLIDGHNLIGQLSDIDLSDPDDEAKLVLKLRQYAGRMRKKITVVFDGGLEAGIEKGLSTHSVQVRFAAERSSADNVIRDIIYKMKNPAGWIVVSSDLAIRNIAQQKRIPMMRADEFAKILNSTLSSSTKRKSRQAAQSSSKKTNPQLSKAEIDEWLDIFSDDSPSSES
jgi:predicted RNA-binding protein with PIN domain